MEWQPLESKMFLSTAYDADDRILYLRFKSGDVTATSSFPRNSIKTFSTPSLTVNTSSTTSATTSNTNASPSSASLSQDGLHRTSPDAHSSSEKLLVFYFGAFQMMNGSDYREHVRVSALR